MLVDDGEDLFVERGDQVAELGDRLGLGGEALLLDRDGMVVVLEGLHGLVDPHAGGGDRRVELGDLAAVLAAGGEVGRGVAGERAAQGAQLGVEVGRQLQGGRLGAVGLLLVVAHRLPGGAGKVGEDRQVVGGEGVNGVEVGTALLDVLGAEGHRDVGCRVAEGVGVGVEVAEGECEAVPGRGEGLEVGGGVVFASGVGLERERVQVERGALNVAAEGGRIVACAKRQAGPCGGEVGEAGAEAQLGGRGGVGQAVGVVRADVVEAFQIGRRQQRDERAGEALAGAGEDVELAGEDVGRGLAEVVLVGEGGVDRRLGGEQRRGLGLAVGEEHGVVGERLAPRAGDLRGPAAEERGRAAQRVGVEARRAVLVLGGIGGAVVPGEGAARRGDALQAGEDARELVGGGPQGIAALEHLLWHATAVVAGVTRRRRLDQRVERAVGRAEPVARGVVEVVRREPGWRRDVLGDSLWRQDERVAQRLVLAEDERAGRHERRVSQAGHGLLGGALDRAAVGGDGAGEDERAADLTRERALLPAGGGQNLAHDERDVAGGGPGAVGGDRVREQERPRLDLPDERAVALEVEGDSEVAAADAQAAHVELDHAAEDAVLRDSRGLDRPAAGAAAGDQPDGQGMLGGIQEVAIDGGDEVGGVAGRQLGGRLVDEDRGAERLETIQKDRRAVVVQGGPGLDLAPRQERVVLGELGRAGQRRGGGVFPLAAPVRVAGLEGGAVGVGLAAGDADPQLAAQTHGAVSVDLARTAGGAAAGRARRLRVARRGGGVRGRVRRRRIGWLFGSTGEGQQGRQGGPDEEGADHGNSSPDAPVRARRWVDGTRRVPASAAVAAGCVRGTPPLRRGRATSRSDRSARRAGGAARPSPSGRRRRSPPADRRRVAGRPPRPAPVGGTPRRGGSRRRSASASRRSRGRGAGPRRRCIRCQRRWRCASVAFLPITLGPGDGLRWALPLRAAARGASR